ncbi:hypothetical protein [Ferruginibacter sp. SUN106]|uniref:hypothetical protein n=1 Tax=Ferruginibacter sp. SUN106 TaxID=2978348 RepID=UPI003D362FAD
MKIILLIGSCSIWLLCNSCLVEKTKYGTVISKRKNEQFTSEGYSITKNGQFKLKNKFQLTDTLLLSPSKVYQSYCYETYEYFKFYDNGRVLNWAINTDPKHMTTAPKYLCGYYVLKNDELKIELSSIATFTFGDSYDILVIKGKAFGDSIKFYKDQWGGTGRNIGHYGGRKNEKGEDISFVRTNKNFIGPQPGW